jgi:branched-chain amino acid transport system substrate-binding protein
MVKPYLRSENFLSYSLVFLLSLVGLTACSQTTSPSQALQGTNPIKIGVSISLSGDFAADGKELQQGYQLWQDSVNQHGGLLGRGVQFDFVSDNSTQEQVTANYTKMITVNHDDLVMGPFSSFLTVPAAAVANRYKYALLEGAGTAPSVFEPRFTNLFSVSLPATSYLKSFVYYLLSLPQSVRPKSVAYVTSDDFFAQPQVDAARALLEKGGIRTALYDLYPADTTTNYSPMVTKVINSHADVVMIGSVGPLDSIPYIKAFKQQHYNPTAIVATAGPDQGNQFTGPIGGTQTAEGVFVPNGGWFPAVQNYQNSQFVSAYIAKYGGTSDAIGADTVEAYSAAQVLEQAVTKIGSVENTKLIQELHADTFNTLQGPVKFADDGQNNVAVAFLFQWQAGHLVVVYPSSSAEKNPEFPKPSWP